MRARTLTATLVVFVVVSSIDAALLWHTRDRHLGVHEDHFDKGVSLYETGSMSSGAKPMVFRPPGYPVFVAVVLEIRDAAAAIARPVIGDLEVSPGGGKRVAVLASHAVLLGVLGAAIFWFTIEGAGILIGAACAIAVACNPLLLIFAGHVSYELLHLTIITIATLMLLRATRAGAPATAAVFGNGLIWGAATLVKSVTLVAPPFIFLWAWFHYGLRNASRTAAYFTAGLVLVVAPYTIRNYAVTGRFVPVNEQASFALWATSLERIPPNANYQHWVTIWFASAMPTYTEVSGKADYDIATFEDHIFEFSDRFRRMASENLRRNPMVYGYNAAHNGVMFLIDSPATYYLSRYSWPHQGLPTIVAKLSLSVMTVIAVIGIIIGCVRRDPPWTLLFALFAVMWAAHALTFLEARYLYVKLPTIIGGFVLAFEAAALSTDRRAVLAAAVVLAGLSVTGLFAL